MAGRRRAASASGELRECGDQVAGAHTGDEVSRLGLRVGGVVDQQPGQRQHPRDPDVPGGATDLAGAGPLVERGQLGGQQGAVLGQRRPPDHTGQRRVGGRVHAVPVVVAARRQEAGSDPGHPPAEVRDLGPQAGDRRDPLVRPGRRQLAGAGDEGVDASGEVGHDTAERLVHRCRRFAVGGQP